MSRKSKEQEKHEELPEFLLLLQILEEVHEIRVLLQKKHVLPTAVQIIQLGGNMITGIQAGAAAPNVFGSDPIPSNVPFPAGTVDTWTSSDPAVTLTPSSTNPAQVLVSTPGSNTNTSFTLTVSTQMPNNPDGSVPPALTSTVTVPIIAAPAPLPTGVQINQIS